LKCYKQADVMKCIAKISTALVLTQCFSLTAVANDYPQVDSNVPYAKVSALAVKAADELVPYGPDPLQYAAVWRPTEELSTSSKVAVLVHGGCWLNAYDIQHSYALSTALAQDGFVVWSLEYRRTGDVGGGWPGTFNDVLAGIEKLASYAPLTLNQAVIIGHSAGGHLALLAGGKLPEVRGVIGLAAITDIVDYAQGDNSCQQVTDDFMGAMPAEAEALYKQANPVNQPMHARTLLLQGDADSIVPLQQASRLSFVPQIEVGAGHFDWIHPGSTAYQRLITNLNEMFE
jgi:acetyl esterase/lipase